MEQKKQVVVIGAGLTGLTCAAQLRQKGIDVLVVEAAPRVGGLMQTEEAEGFIMECGPSTGTIKYAEVAELFDSLGEDCCLEVARTSAKKRLIWKKDQFHALPSGLFSAIKTPLFTMKDKLRILGEPWRQRGTDPNESVGSLAARRLGQSFVDYAVDPFLSGVYAGDPYSLPTRLALPKLYQLEQHYGSFIKGAFALYRKPKSARERRATKDVFSTKGGFKNLISALVKAIGKEYIYTSCHAVQISPMNDGWQVRWEGGSCWAKQVITTCPAYALPSILPFVSSELRSDLSNLNYAPIIEVGVGLRDTGSVHWKAFGGLVPTCEHQSILGVLMPSACFEGRSPSQGATFAFFMGGVRHPEYLEKSDEEITQIVNECLVSMLKFPTGTTADVMRIHRYEHAIPQYTSTTDARIKAIDIIEQQFPGLHIIGNLKDGIGMGDRIKQAMDMARKTFLCF